MVPFGKLTFVCRPLEGFFNIRPDLPRYATTWDVTKVFTFNKSKPIFADCDLTTVSQR